MGSVDMRVFCPQEDAKKMLLNQDQSVLPARCEEVSEASLEEMGSVDMRVF